MSDANITYNSLPNPLAPAAWLSPNLALQYEVAKGVFWIVLGAWTWDLLTAVGDDIQMFRNSKLEAAFNYAVYVLSRIFTFGFILGSLIFECGLTAHQDCLVPFNVLAWFGTCAIPSNSLLFFLRVRGVFFHDRWIVAGFFVLWLSTLSALVEPFGFKTGHIGPTPYCLIADVAKFTSAGYIAVAIFDTSVFVGISLRMLSNSIEQTWRGRFKMFFSGRCTGKVSRALLQTGQLYYLVTVWVNLVLTVILLMSLISPTSEAMFTVPNIALQNVMACRVFRLLKLGYIQKDATIREDAPLALPGGRILTFGRTPCLISTIPNTQENTLGPVGDEAEEMGSTVTNHDSQPETPLNSHTQGVSNVRQVKEKRDPVDMV
ncbi:unnamed protein product [Somion occarium]|uniref:Transmembrane protein n=1 Tax=Somion occarium TaxID=3059160 RepID=A0ABP1CFQ1_9APHY